MSGIHQAITSVLLRIPLGSVNQSLSLFRASSAGCPIKWLRLFYQQPIHQQALYLASPALFEEMQPWLEDERTELSPAMEVSLAKCAIRSATRATPFGLFAGLSLASLGERTECVLSTEKIDPFTRLDSAALVQLYKQFLAKPLWRRQLRYKVTNSAYRIQNQYRYSEFIETDQERQVVMSSLLTDRYLDELVGYAQVYRSFDQLTSFMASVAQVNGAEIDDAEADDYIDTLIGDKFLLSDLEPTVTGKPYIEQLRDGLTNAGQSDEQSRWLHQQPGLINELMDVARLKRTDSWLKQHDIVSTDSQSFWQTNLWFKTQSATVGRPVTDRIGAQISELFCVLEQRKPDWIGPFAERFRSLYQDQAVPLLSVLDNESGLGLQTANGYLSASAPRASKLLTNLSGTRRSPSAPPTKLDGLRRRLIERMRRTNAIACELDLSDFSTIQAKPGGCWSALGTLLGPDSATIDAGKFDFLLRSISANPTAVAGRFCPDSGELTDVVTSIHKQIDRQFPTCIFAEVAHLAGARSGNVNVRPTLSPYEIPYLTPASVDDEHTIFLNDLVVSVNQNHEISLFSGRLGKRVIPRLTTAHNPTQGDEIYQFLCGVAHEHSTIALWSWGAFNTEPVLPAVRYKNVIVARARWHISAEVLGRFKKPLDCWEWFSQTYAVVRRVTIQTGDNELLVDSHSPIGLRFIIDALTKQKKITLVEWLNEPDRCWIKDALGDPYAHEAVLFLPWTVSPATLAKYNRVQKPLSDEKRVTRKFLPGSEWLYLKLYTGPQTADTLLTGPITNLLAALSQPQRIDQWFFIRYSDPEFHLRLRVRCPDERLRGQVMMDLLTACQQWTTDGLIRSVQIDTYDREIERYGEQTIALCEYYFAADSRMIIDFLTRYPDADEEIRILFAIISTEALLTDFGFTASESLAFLRSRQAAYQLEFSADKASKDLLNQQFRDYRALLINLEARFDVAQETAECQSMGQLLYARTADTQSIIQELKNKLLNADPTFIYSLVSSLLHMSMDRLFISQLRLYELMVYHLTCRQYESIVARSKP